MTWTPRVALASENIGYSIGDAILTGCVYPNNLIADFLR